MTEVVPDMFRIARDDHAPDRGAHGAAAEPEEEPGEHELPELGRDRAPEHRERGDEDTATHHERDVAAVAVARQEQLRAEPGEEAGGNDEAELRLREAEAITQVREQRVDRAVSERHGAGHHEQGDHAARREPLRHGNRLATSAPVRPPWSRSVSMYASRSGIPVARRESGGNDASSTTFRICRKNSRTTSVVSRQVSTRRPAPST